MFSNPLSNRRAKAFQPWPPIVIVERDAPPNLLDIRRRVKIVCILKLPRQLIGQQASDGRFAGADDSHHDHDHA